MKNFKNITDISLRDVGELYIGDIVYVKKDSWHYIKKAIIAGFDYNKDEWLVTYTSKDRKSEFDTCSEHELELIGTTVKYNKEEDIHEYMMEIINIENEEA